MNTPPLRVVLLMETSLLSSAMAQVLARDPRLLVEVHPPGGTLDAREAVPRRTGRTVAIAVLEDPELENPPRIELHADGEVRVVPYQGLHGLAALLTQC